MQHYKHFLLDETLQPHLVLMHSAYRNHQSFDHFIKAYNDTYLHDFDTLIPNPTFGQVWGMDLRGHGMSLQMRQPVPYTARTHSTDLRGFLKEGKIRDEPHAFVANGVGGLALLDHWLGKGDFGHGGVIIDAQPGMSVNPFPKVLGRTFRKFDKWVSFMQETYLPHQPRNVIGALLQRNVYRRKDGVYAWMIDPNFRQPEEDLFSDGLWKRLKSAKPGPKTKVVFVRGGSSPYTEYDKMKNLVDMMNESQNKEWVHLEEVKGAGHYVQEENPRAVAEALHKYVVPQFHTPSTDFATSQAKAEPFVPGRNRLRIGQAFQADGQQQTAGGPGGRSPRRPAFVQQQQQRS